MRLRRGIISWQAQQCIVLLKIQWSQRTEACIINGLWVLGQKCWELQSDPLFLSRPFPSEPVYTRDNELFVAALLSSLAEAAVGCGGADRAGGRPGSALPGERHGPLPRRIHGLWKHQMLRRSAQTNSTSVFSTVHRDAGFDMKSAQIIRLARPKIMFAHLHVAQHRMIFIFSHLKRRYFHAIKVHGDQLRSRPKK